MGFFFSASVYTNHSAIPTFAHNIMNNQNSLSDFETILNPENIIVIEQEDLPKIQSIQSANFFLYFQDIYKSLS